MDREARVRTVGKGQEVVMTAADGVLVDAWLAELFADVPSVR